MEEQNTAKTTIRETVASKPQATNGLAIAGFICSFFVSLLGIILGAVALGQIKKTGEGGKGLAIAGIVIGSVSTVIGIAAFVMFVIIGASTANTVTNYYNDYYDRYNNSLNSGSNYNY